MRTQSTRIRWIAVLAALLLLLQLSPGAMLAQTSPNIEEIIREQTMEAFTPIPAADPDLLVVKNTASPSPTKVTSVFNCFPTCSTSDGRFLVIAAGAAFNSFSDQAQFFRIAVEAGTTSFTLGVFDGDALGLAPLSDSYWDLGAPALFEYTLFADPFDDGGGTTVVPLGGQPSALSTSMLNNDWTDFTVTTDAAAQAPSGAFFYRLKIELTDPAVVTMNAFKVRTSGQVTFEPQVISYIANFSSFVDGLLLYPGFPKSTPSTYDGTFNFFFEAPADQTEIVVWDGDFDHGSWDLVDQDTDDPDTPGAPFLPSFSSGDAVPEGIAIGDQGTTGAPRDDMDPDSGAGFGAFQLRSPSIRYNLITPDNQSFANGNPSGNQEWEQFRIALGSVDPAQGDHSATSLPSGIYQVAIEGVDLQNLNAILLPFRALCVDENGCPARRTFVPS